MTERPPHPVARLGPTLGRLPRYLVLARSLLGEPGLARWRKVAVGASLAYLASPIDLVPGIIPVAGQLDDLAAVLLGLRVGLAGCPPARAEAHLRDAGLSASDLESDLVAVRNAAGWVARGVARASARVAVTLLRGLAALARGGARGSRWLIDRRRSR